MKSILNFIITFIFSGIILTIFIIGIFVILAFIDWDISWLTWINKIIVEYRIFLFINLLVTIRIIIEKTLPRII